MALPSTVGTASTDLFFTAIGYAGPVQASGHFYVAVRYAQPAGDSDRLNLMKADGDDPEDAWTVIDQNAPEPSAGAGIDYTSLWIHVDGTTLHFVSQTDAFALEYHQFDSATDTWSVVDEAFDSGAVPTTAFASCSVRSDGDVIAAYQGTTDANMGNDYDRADIGRRESGSWTVAISADGLGKVAEHSYQPVVQRGDSANDRMHIAFKNHQPAGLALFSTYLSDNTLGHTASSLTSDDVHDLNFIFSKGISFDDGGTVKVRFPVYIETNFDCDIAGFDDGDSPTASVLAAGIADAVSIANALNGPVFHLDVNGTKQHFLWIDSSGDDVNSAETGTGDDSWGTSTLEETLGVSTHHLSGNVYTRSGGTKLAYVYNDNGTIAYNEIDITIISFAFPPFNPTAFHPFLAR